MVRALPYDNGKVPCCVDEHGATPVPENDSHGEFIYLVAEYYRHRRSVRAALERGVARGELNAGIDHELAVDMLVGPVYYGLLSRGEKLDISPDDLARRRAQGLAPLNGTARSDPPAA